MDMKPKVIQESGTEQIAEVQVNFNWQYKEGEQPDRITASATLETGMHANFAYTSQQEQTGKVWRMESSIYGALNETGSLVDGVLEQFEIIKASFNQ